MSTRSYDLSDVNRLVTSLTGFGDGGLLSCEV